MDLWDNLLAETNSLWCHYDFRAHSVWQVAAWREEPAWARGNRAQTLGEVTCSFHDKWPASLISGRADGFSECVSSSTGGRGTRGKDEEDEEEMSHLLQHVTTLHSSLPAFCFCGKQAGGEDLNRLSLYRCVCVQLSLQYVYVILSLCYVIHVCHVWVIMHGGVCASIWSFSSIYCMYAVCFGLCWQFMELCIYVTLSE